MTTIRQATLDMTIMHALHDAFRRDLDLLTVAAARQDDDPLAAERIRLGWRLLADQLHHHHTVEDDVIWPLVRANWRRSADALDILDGMEAEHDLIDPALAAVDEAVRAQRDPAEALDRLHGIVWDHLAHEEQEAMPLIEVAVTQREWDALNSQQARAMGLRGAAGFFPWLLNGADDIRTEKVLGVLPFPLRWAYRQRWQPRWAATHSALIAARP